MTLHETGSTTTPVPPRDGTAAAHVRLPGADPGRSQRRLPPGLPGAAVPVPQHRPRPGRPSRRVLRPRHAGRRADHAPDLSVSTRPARRRGGHRHHQPGDLGPPPHGHARRPLGLARHRARLPRPAPRESPPPGLLRAPRIPRRPRPPPHPMAGHPRPRTTPAGASRNSSASPGKRSMRPAALSGSRQPARRRWSDGFSPSHNPSPRPWHGDGRAATPPARSSSTATASPSGAGARRGAPPARRPGCRPASSTIAGAPLRVT